MLTAPTVYENLPNSFPESLHHFRFPGVTYWETQFLCIFPSIWCLSLSFILAVLVDMVMIFYLSLNLGLFFFFYYLGCCVSRPRNLSTAHSAPKSREATPQGCSLASWCPGHEVRTELRACSRTRGTFPCCATSHVLSSWASQPRRDSDQGQSAWDSASSGHWVASSICHVAPEVGEAGSRLEAWLGT